MRIIVDGLSDRTVATAYAGDTHGIPGDAFSAIGDIGAAIAAALLLDAVVIMLGTNDARSDVAAVPAEVGDAVSEIVEGIGKHAGGVATTYPAPRVLVVAPPAIGDTSATPIAAVTEGSDERSGQIADAIVASGRANGFAVFDARTMVSVDSVDGVHLTDAMHEALGLAIAERVERLLDGASR